MSKDDILQLIIQYLNQNYPEISKNLPIDLEEKFTGHKLKEVVLEGRWDEILSRLEGCPSLELPIFRILEQKIHEALQKGNQKEAFEILRNDLSPLNIFPEKIHKLAQDILLMKASAKDRSALAQELFGDLKGVPGLMISEDRLEELVNQAIKYQEYKCPYHYSKELFGTDSTWYDHKCPTNSPIVLNSMDVNRIKIEVTPECPGDLFTLLATDNYSKIILIDEYGKMSQYTRKVDSSGWNIAGGAEGDGKFISIWPKCVQGTQMIHQVLEFDNKDQIPTILEPILSENMMALSFMPGNNQDCAIFSNEDQWTIYYNIRLNQVIHSWTRLRCSHILTPKELDEKYFLAVSDNGSVLQISTETYEVMRTIQAVDEKLQASSAFLDGKRLLLGYNNSTIYYYDDWENYGYPTRIFRGHKCTKYRVNSILSRFDSNIAISCSENGSIYVWNIGTGRLIYEIKVHQEGYCVNDIIEIDRKTFVTCGDGNELYQWTLP